MAIPNYLRDRARRVAYRHGTAGLGFDDDAPELLRPRVCGRAWHEYHVRRAVRARERRVRLPGCDIQTVDNTECAGALARLGSQRKAQQKRDEQVLDDAKALAARLEAAKVAVKAKAGGNGKLFGAVTNADVATAIAQSLEVTIDKHKIELKTAIKALGSYPVEIKLHKNVVAKTTVDVVAA